MIGQCGRLALLAGAALACAAPAYPDPPADLSDEPLPEGAVARCGISRPILRSGPSVGLIPPTYKEFLAPTTNGTVRRYHLGTGRPLDSRGIVGPGTVVVAAEGKRAAVARPGSISVVDVATGKAILAVEPPRGVTLVGTPGVSLSADGAILAYGGRDQDGVGQAVVWHVDRNELIAQVQTAPPEPVFPTLSPDGKTLVTHGPPVPAPTLTPVKPAAVKPLPKTDQVSDIGRTAQVWSTATGKELFKARLIGMGGHVAAAAFTRDGRRLALSAGGGATDLWDVQAGKHLHTLLGCRAQGVKLAFSPDGKTVASVGPDYRIERWSVEDGAPLGISDPPIAQLVAPISGLVFADNKRVIAWMTAAQFAVAWEAPAGQLRSPASDHRAAINSIALPAGRKVLYSAGIDGHLFAWDVATGKLNEEVPLRPARYPGAPVVLPIVHLSADATRAVWIARPTTVFDVASGADLFCVPRPSGPVAPYAMGLSPDGTMLTAVSRQAGTNPHGLFVLWHLAARRRLAEFAVPPSGNAASPMAALSPDNRRVVISTILRRPSGKQVLRVTGFDVKTGKQLAEVEDIDIRSNVMLELADATTAVFVEATGRAWTVDYAKGRVEPEFDRLPTRGEPRSGPIAFSPDGKRCAIAVGGTPFTTYGVRVYDWQHRKVLRTFIGHAAPVTALRFSADGMMLASGSHDTSVLLWDLSKLGNAK